MEVKDLKPAGYNPRIITEKKLDMLGRALAEFGDLSGIVFNVRTGNLVGGHQRIKRLKPEWAIRKEPATDATGTVALGYVETPWGRLVYREVDWPLKKEKAANVAANNHGGVNDMPLLKEILVELKNDGEIDLELTGFTGDEVKDILGLADIVPLPDLPTGGKSPFVQMTFTLHDEQVETVKRAIKKAAGMGAYRETQNENSNGNALDRICRTFMGHNENS